MSGARDAIVRSRASTPCQTQPGRFTSRLRVLARRSLDGVDTRAYSGEVLKHSPIEKQFAYSSLTFLLPGRGVADGSRGVERGLARAGPDGLQPFGDGHLRVLAEAAALRATPSGDPRDGPARRRDVGRQHAARQARA